MQFVIFTKETDGKFGRKAQIIQNEFNLQIYGYAIILITRFLIHYQTFGISVILIQQDYISKFLVSKVDIKWSGRKKLKPKKHIRVFQGTTIELFDECKVFMTVMLNKLKMYDVEYYLSQEISI